MSLSNEYKKYLITQRQLSILNAYIGNNKKLRYEVRNILERYKISYYNFGVNTGKMKEELLTKKIVNKNDIDSIINKLVLAEVDTYKDLNHKEIVVGNTIRYGRYSRVIHNMKLLKTLGTDKEIALCAMRYSSIISGGQQWNIPNTVYAVAVKKHNVTLEGFASPFNSQLLKFHKTHNVKICTLFIDTDAPFKSIGSFFDLQTITRLSGFINPPYIEDVMNACAEHCHKLLSNSTRTRLIVTVPEWRDAKYYSVFHNSKYLETYKQFKANEHYYMDSTGNKTIKALFPTIVFILSVNMPAEDYSELFKAFTMKKYTTSTTTTSK